MTRGDKMMIAFCSAILVVLAVSVTLLLTDHVWASHAVSVLGTWGVLIFTMMYIVVFDSRKRWPDANVAHRFYNLVTFKR